MSATQSNTAKTLYDKLWDAHLVSQRDDGSSLIYIDRQLLHEVTSPQAFEGLSSLAVSLGVYRQISPPLIIMCQHPPKSAAKA